MIHRVVFEEQPRRRRLAPVKVVTPALALVLGAVALGEWACAPRATQIGPRATAALASQAAAAPLQQQPQTQPQPAAQQEPAPAPQPPASLAQLDAQMATAMRGVAPEEVERRVREGAQQAAAEAFPVQARMDMSSTMYCLKGQMRTGVRTRDGMAAGDPRVLPLGSVVRVSRPSGELIGIFVIMDTGGAINGNKIDLYVDSCREAERWGRHPVVVEVLDIGKRI